MLIYMYMYVHPLGWFRSDNLVAHGASARMECAGQKNHLALPMLTVRENGVVRALCSLLTHKPPRIHRDGPYGCSDGLGRIRQARCSSEIGLAICRHLDLDNL